MAAWLHWSLWPVPLSPLANCFVYGCLLKCATTRRKPKTREVFQKDDKHNYGVLECLKLLQTFQSITTRGMLYKTFFKSGPN